MMITFIHYVYLQSSFCVYLRPPGLICEDEHVVVIDLPGDILALINDEAVTDVNSFHQLLGTETGGCLAIIFLCPRPRTHFIYGPSGQT